MRNIFFSCLLLFPCFLAHAQIEESIDKYWNYRNNLTSKFVIVGTEMGMGMPAAYRNDLAGEIKWADNMIGLGWYLGVLATEYELLHNKEYSNYNQGGQIRIAQNKFELYCALQALKRLDESAEDAFTTDHKKTQVQQKRNGFMIRDDVPESFHQNFPNMERSLSDYTSSEDFDKEMSQDQVYHILLGLALVKKFIPSSEAYQGMNYIAEAEKTARLLLHYISSNRWRIKNPLKFEDERKLKSVKRGHQAYIFSGGIQSAVNFIAGEKVKPVHKPGLFYRWYWKTLKRSWNPTYSREHNVHMVMSSAAAGNGWKERTPKTLIKLSHKYEWSAYPLIHEALFEPQLSGRWIEKYDEVRELAAQQIALAPDNGIRSPYPGEYDHKWSNNMRYIRDLKTQIHGRQHSQNRTYNGLDFMLLFNCYYLTQK